MDPRSNAGRKATGVVRLAAAALAVAGLAAPAEAQTTCATPALGC